MIIASLKVCPYPRLDLVGALEEMSQLILHDNTMRGEAACLNMVLARYLQ